MDYTTQGKTYLVIVKSHTDAPDYETQVEAQGLEEAVEKVYKDSGWSKNIIRDNIMEVA